MASLKELKGRIGSVRNTLKITSAMKVVASTKLHRAQTAIENMLPYAQRLSALSRRLLGSGVEIASPLTEERKSERVTIIAIASNSSLCGGYNSTVIRQTLKVIQEYSLKAENLQVYPIGRKVAQALAKSCVLTDTYKTLGEHTTYAQAAELADTLMAQYAAHETDRVELVYMHYKSTSTQVLTRETFLPMPLEQGDGAPTDYIVEPSVPELAGRLIPQSLRVKLYATLLDAAAAEHAARTVAMQQATDNAEDLLQELSLMYNKGRQQAITAELLDIVGGSMA